MLAWRWQCLFNSTLHEVRGQKVSTFGCALDCGDGRCQGPSRKWQKARFGVEAVDKITVAGLVKRLIDRDTLTMDFVKRELLIYLTKHGSSVVTISAHDDCAGNRATKKRQLRQLRKARRIINDIIKSFNLDRAINVFLLWVNGRWMPEEIDPKSHATGYYTKVRI